MATKLDIVVAANDSRSERESFEQKKMFRVDERNSHEIILGFAGPVGSGVTTVANLLRDIIDVEYGYQVVTIKVSELIREFAHMTSHDLSIDMDARDRFEKYQDAGNELRGRSPSYLADRVIEKINKNRRDLGGTKVNEKAPDIALQKRIAYIIDSLKNPAEVYRLRQIYGDLFWHLTVFAPETVRETRLIANGVDETQVKQIMKRDENEDNKKGQQVSKTAHLADYFIRNHTNTIDDNRLSVQRFLDTVFGTKLYTPSFQEQGMMKAAAAGVESACMSRQVGASIYNKEGELLGVGCNDVPKYGGGLYGAEDVNDNRCYRWGGKICHNDDRKIKLAGSISKALAPSDASQRQVAFDVVRQSESKNLIEFSRSVHAEMEAIVSIARAGKGSTVGGSLFTTTYPCHNCARHIIASGITTVIYIEPYTKSLALKLHHDAITMTDEINKVQFKQYEGFAPSASLRVYSSVGKDRKNDTGHYVETSRREAVPIFRHSLDSYMSSEELVINELSNLDGGRDG